MKDIVLDIQGVSKQYRLGLTGTGSLAHDLNRFWYKVRGKEDPYLKVGEENDRAVEGGDYIWALKDVNIQIQKGEIVGIIGRNGAGKSTLLKLLSRITAPSFGEIKVEGRMSSLLEVGTGFHPELTGRENIFLNGAILGMSRKEVGAKLDEIIEFSGCAKYIDTPVKRYSSGMRVRLGFAVAAFLEPDILVVDEVLAVGDAEFQKKAIGKMKSISSQSERTVLFVSHNMASIQNLCSRVIIMEKGGVTYDGEVNEGIDKYLRGEDDLSTKGGNHRITVKDEYTGPANFSELLQIRILTKDNQSSNVLFTYEPFKFQMKFKLNEPIGSLELGVAIVSAMGVKYGAFVNSVAGAQTSFEAGEHEIEISCPGMFLTPGNYYLTIWIKRQTEPVDAQYANVMQFSVSFRDNENQVNYIPDYFNSFGVLVRSNWQIK